VGQAIHDAVASGVWNYAQLPVIGFDHAQLARVKAAYPDIHIGVSFSKKMLEYVPADKHTPYMVAKASGMHAQAINPDYRLVTQELVESAHAAGLKVNVWTVNNSTAMRNMIALGVDAIMTDYPNRLYEILHGGE
jgi:glycerophosphoryl diester phosphodiesterase